jgi:ATP adenylyltransferase
MSKASLHAPWRMDYIRSLERHDDSGPCFLCAAAAAPKDDRELRKRLLVLWSSQHCVVIINRYPYTNGHLLIAPKAHKADLEQLSRDEVLDMQIQTIESIKLLKNAMSPQGFNIGTNLGRCAGAGLPGHVHQHVVPRWGGDTNFMSVVGDVRIVPQAISQLYDELLAQKSHV